jgi:2-dehydro-3-deoxygalactonokinase
MARGPLLAVDWGTTNVRAWRLGGGGEIEAHAEFPLGVSRLSPGEAAQRFANEIRPGLGAETLPALLCGMVGSNLGWILAPYLDCPASPGALAGALAEAGPGVHIVPGLRCEGLVGPDVMRGEETQVLGWLTADPARELGRHILCLPGTHAKWVVVEAGVVTRFLTAMTGELYDLLGSRGVLKFQAREPGSVATGTDPYDWAAFDAGARAAADGGALSSRLFGLRGLTLNGRLAPASAPAWLSGLLIGAEIAALWPLIGGDGAQPVHLVGEERLRALYGRVLRTRGIASAGMEGDGAVLMGLKRIWSETP